ncbi:hypothetical protein ACH5RR_031633 [Cinchona calisaya]|uniref:Uncharacterized protein n=1 Tax=Cinchona calisaya TaxID=153742 RepID=A0ABD2YH55_9GENT
MYEYGLEVEGGGNDYDYDVVVCKIKVDYSKSSKGGRLDSRRSHINSTKYLSMESKSSLDHVDLDDGSVNRLGRKRPPTQSVFYDQESGNNDNKKKARSSGVVSYFQDLLSEDTDKRREEIIVENINKMLANIHEEEKDHHGTNYSVSGPMASMIDQAASKDDNSSAISSRFNNIRADADADVDAAALIGDNCSNPINLDDFEEVDHHHNCHTAALIGYYDNVPSSSNDVLTIEDYPVDDVRFTMDALLGDDQHQLVNNVVNEEEQKIFDDESSQHCPTTTLHEDEEANSNATTAISDAIAAAPQNKDDDYIDHNPLLNPNLLLEDDIESILKLFPDVENLGEEFYSNPNAFFEMET